MVYDQNYFNCSTLDIFQNNFQNKSKHIENVTSYIAIGAGFNLHFNYVI
jgi:hypothetical protein